ncbi:type II toxin-antitoxin system Phd/YefM family antitoxin [Microbacterium sp. EST19A]|uniref:type II toxin-antitoxin system Phd/YefM family antitoxin n=1 Tax=Microbacterium sp. EST19A TaxID=2862681 RepID=UPI001CBDF936|nr:type II toxin-antitoxin system prevent-host-death family antitoxin [Microbacterium sp. EST19A]
MSIISASAARQSLPTQLDRVEAGEEVSITRHGRVVAVLVRPDVLAARRATAAWRAADQIETLLTRARDEPLKPPAMTIERADELIESVRSDRAAR